MQPLVIERKRRAVVAYQVGERIATVSAGPYHDKLDRSGSGSYRYHVSEAATAACSNDAAVTFRHPGRWR